LTSRRVVAGITLEGWRMRQSRALSAMAHKAQPKQKTRRKKDEPVDEPVENPVTKRRDVMGALKRAALRCTSTSK
jgi:hypothetical protein